MAEAPTILELVRNGTLSAEMAATLWTAAEERWSWVVSAVPRLAGKTTLTNAMLQLLPPDVAVHRLNGDEGQMDRLKEAALGGYLVVGEFSRAPVPTYIWGAPVRRVFETLGGGYSLATALHAPSLQGVFDVICQGNGVGDEAASRIDLVVYIRLLGDGPDGLWRRVAEVHEVDRVEGGSPVARLVHRWVEGEDRFEAVAASRLDGGRLASRAAALRSMAAAGHTSSLDLVAMLDEDRGR